MRIETISPVTAAAHARAAAPDLAPPPLAHGQGWELQDERTATDAIVEAIDGARIVVNAEFFGIGDAGKGARVTDALVRAAQRGVEVNLLAVLDYHGGQAMAPLYPPGHGNFNLS